MLKKFLTKEKICSEKLKKKYSKYLPYKFLSIQNKSEIAQKNGLDDKMNSMLTEFRKNSNTYIHTNLFREPKSIDEKDSELKQLIKFDCFLLTDALCILLECCNFFSKDEINIDPFKKSEQLQNILDFYDRVIISY